MRIRVPRGQLVGIALDDDHEVVDAGLLEVLAGDGDAFGVEVVGVELPSRLAEGHREPEARFAREVPSSTKRLAPTASVSSRSSRPSAVETLA